MLSSGSGSLPNGSNSDHGKDRIQHIRAFLKESPFHHFHLLFHRYFLFATLVAFSGSFVARRSAAAISISTTSRGRRAVLEAKTVVTCLESKGERCMLEEWICARFHGKDISGYLQITRYLGEQIGQNYSIYLQILARHELQFRDMSRCFCGDGRVCILFARRHRTETMVINQKQNRPQPRKLSNPEVCPIYHKCKILCWVIETRDLLPALKVVRCWSYPMNCA